MIMVKKVLKKEQQLKLGLALVKWNKKRFQGPESKVSVETGLEQFKVVEKIKVAKDKRIGVCICSICIEGGVDCLKSRVS